MEQKQYIKNIKNTIRRFKNIKKVIRRFIRRFKKSKK